MQVRDDVFETIDNLQLADPEVLEMSQSSGNTSDRYAGILSLSSYFHVITQALL